MPWEALSQEINLNDDPADGIAMVLEHLYTLEIPFLPTMYHAKWAFTLGDKYSLPKLRGAGAVRLIFFHRLFWDAWVHFNDELKIRHLEHLEEV